MSTYMIDATKVAATKTDWGKVKNVFDSKSIQSGSGFTFGEIVYEAPHFSGTHTDNEAVHVLAGAGVATIGDQKIPFAPGCLLVIPAGIPHGITEVTRGPIECMVIHFG